MLLDVAVSAVMVGQHQSFRGDDFPRTSASEMHHGIFQADVVRTVHLVNADVQSQILHHGSILLFQVGQHPHSLIRMSGEGKGGK